MAGTFSLDLARLCKKADADVKLAVRKIAFEAFKRVILRSPVDTGRFRANWGVQVGSPWTGTVDVYDKDGRGTVQLAANGVQGWNANGSIVLSNSLSYAMPLEYLAHSSQAPQGMVRVTCAEMQAWAQSAENVKQPISEIRGATGGDN